MRLKGLEWLKQHYIHKKIRIINISMATPVVSGAIAMLLQQNEEMTNEDIKKRLEESCMDLKRPINEQGWGLLQIENMLKF